MKKKRSKIILLSVLASLPATSFALNPVIQTMYTADPAPVVHDGTLYLFSSHDEDAGKKGNFNLKNWTLASTTDLVNWTQHGAIASLRDFPWAAKEISGWDGFENGAWASQAIERDGKWYLYCPIQGRGIGVLVADNPLGPYTDPLKKPLIGGQYDSIDPTVYIDDKGQAYLAWGNPKLWSVKLNKDMISYDTSVGENGIIRHPMTVEALGERIPPNKDRGTSYEEGPWLYKRNNRYYLFFAAGPIPEHLGYSIGPTAEGPWTYGGVVMTPQSAFTNHPGVVDYKGKTYLFYHNAALPGGDGFKRSVCVEELKFNPDGSVSMVLPTKEGPAAVGTLDPYKRVEAETIAWSSGVKIEPCSAGGQAVRNIHDGDYIRVNNVNFGATAARAFMAVLSSPAQAKDATGAKIEIRLDKLDGPLIGTLPVSGTGGEWKPQFTRISGASGVHDLFFVFHGAVGEDLFKFDYWQFSQRDLPANIATTVTNGQTIGSGPRRFRAVMPMPGFNLGNTLESTWGYAPPTKALIDSIAKVGFKTLRVPCAWDFNSTNGTINPAYMTQVANVVDWALADGMYVIINDHWDKGWFERNGFDSYDSKLNSKLISIWTQVANRFKRYNIDKLAFACANEPNAGNQAQTKVLYQYYQNWINAMRANGGGNAARWLIVQAGCPWDWNVLLNYGLKMPADPAHKLMIEEHTYDPGEFTTQDSDADWRKMKCFWGSAYHVSKNLTNRNCTTQEEAYLQEQFTKLKTNFADKGYPVLLGEYFANAKPELSELSGAYKDQNFASVTYWNKFMENTIVSFGFSGTAFVGVGALFDPTTGAVVNRPMLNAVLGISALPPIPGL